MNQKQLHKIIPTKRIKGQCGCRLCKWSRELTKISKKLSIHDRNRLEMIVGAIWDENEHLSMQLLEVEK